MSKEFRSRKELIDILNKILKNEKTNRNLIKDITKAFVEKGLSGTIPALLFDEMNGSVVLEDLNDIELMCLVDNLKKETDYSELRNSEFFSSTEKDDYINYFEINEERNIMVFHNVSDYSNEHGICFNAEYRLEDMYKDQLNRNLRYNFETQREAQKRKDKQGNIKKSITLNMDSVNDIKNEFKNGTYFPPDVLTLNIPIITGKRPNIAYDKESRTLTIKPNYEFDEVNYTAIDVVDGWHRISGAYELYRNNEENSNSTKMLPVIITSMTIDQAKKFIVRKSKGNRMSAEHIKSLETGGVVDFAKKLNSLYDNDSNILKNKIADTFEDIKPEHKFTDMETIKNALKLIDGRKEIDFDDFVEVSVYSEKFVKTITSITNFIKKSIFKNDSEAFNNSIYVSKNIWIGYIAIANKLKNKDESEVVKGIVESSRKITELNSDDIFKLKLTHQVSYGTKQIFEFFENLA